MNQYITKEKQSKKLPEKTDLFHLWNLCNADTSFKPYFSIRFIAKLCKISPVTAIKLIHYLNISGAIKTTFDGPEFMTSCRPGDEKYLNGFYGYKYSQSGGLYRTQPACHEFIEDPIKDKKMTLKRFKQVQKNIKVRKFINELNELNINVN